VYAFTGWPAATIAVGVGVFTLPKVMTGRAAAERIRKLEALEPWTRRLRVSRMPTEDALRLFADELDDPTYGVPLVGTRTAAAGPAGEPQPAASGVRRGQAPVSSFSVVMCVVARSGVEGRGLGGRPRRAVRRRPGRRPLTTYKNIRSSGLVGRHEGATLGSRIGRHEGATLCSRIRARRGRDEHAACDRHESQREGA
jgi:hypothetical protein